MDEVATQLDTIDDLTVFAYPPDRLEPPAGVVAYPESIAYDVTYRRGADRITLPVVIVLGRVSDRSTRDALAAFADGSGAKSVKAVLEAGTYTEIGSLTVTEVEFDTVRVAAQEFLSAVFSVDIVGSGTS